MHLSRLVGNECFKYFGIQHYYYWVKLSKLLEFQLDRRVTVFSTFSSQAIRIMYMLTQTFNPHKNETFENLKRSTHELWNKLSFIVSPQSFISVKKFRYIKR